MTPSVGPAVHLCDVFAAQERYHWTAKASTAAERIAHLRRLGHAIDARAEALADALYADLRYSAARVGFHIQLVRDELENTIAHLDEWMRPTRLEPSAPSLVAETFVQYESRGVCLLFGPWNYPFLLVFQPLVAILAAGNTAIVKPNELTPATATVIAEIIRETFDEDHVAVVLGGVELAEAMLELPVDHIFFTGSPAVGRVVMAAAARHLATVTLELGGKCPAVVDGSVDVERVAGELAQAKHVNFGQICLPPDYAWVQEDVKDAFLAAYVEWLRENLCTAGELTGESFGKIVNQRNVDRLSGYVVDATDRGATVLLGGSPQDEVFPPTVLVDVPLDASVMQEEIFGPITPILTYRDRDEVVDHFRSGGKPLAMYIYSNDETTVADLLERTSSGGVTVRGWALHYLDEQLPFGGVGTSGIGRYHGVHGFRELTHARSVVVALA